MREQLQRRLEELKKEFGTGQARAVELEKQQATLHQALLRISGAIQVLEEELKAQPQDAAQNASAVGDASQVDTSYNNGSPAHAGA
jgi:predicted  nucleic acid-binding Zn-ribbon protein